jgi:hypothetical protein
MQIMNCHSKCLRTSIWVSINKYVSSSRKDTPHLRSAQVPLWEDDILLICEVLASQSFPHFELGFDAVDDLVGEFSRGETPA